MDIFRGHRKTLDSVCDQAIAVTPSDALDLALASRALYVGSGGDITVTLTGQADPVQFRNLPSGMLLPLRVRRVHATGTTAALLVALL